MKPLVVGIVLSLIVLTVAASSKISRLEHRIAVLESQTPKDTVTYRSPTGDEALCLGGGVMTFSSDEWISPPHKIYFEPGTTIYLTDSGYLAKCEDSL